jgi:hypothetical protein
MFNNSINNRTQYIPYEKSVKIQHAPTDEGLKLLHEMEQKIKDNLINSIKVEGNVFNFKSMIFLTFNSFNYYGMLGYTLNGKEETIDFEIPYEIRRMEFKEKCKTVYDILVKLIAERLARDITLDIIEKNSNMFK